MKKMAMQVLQGALIGLVISSALFGPIIIGWV
jgi:hypothetical protein